MLIVNVPIESLEERYSAQWNKWFEDYVKENRIDYVRTMLPPPLRNTIKDGDFLDVIGTVSYKSQQIDMICREVDNGNIPRDQKVVFLIQDGWFPIEQLAYLRDMLGCHYWKFVGIFHAGTYSKWDLTARSHMYTWGEDLENSWFKIYDKIVVGSIHHAELLQETRKIAAHKVQVIPWKVEVPDLDLTHKENIVVFPHRFGVEKQVHKFKDLAHEFEQNASWDFVRSTEVCKTKQEYYELLAKSKIAISFGLEELFGISMVEATLLGCIPLVPNAFSYKDMYRAVYRYDDIPDLISGLKVIMDTTSVEHITVNPFHSSYNIMKCNYPFYPTLFELMGEL